MGFNSVLFLTSLKQLSLKAGFLLTNTGNQPLIIITARASCGCTNSRYSKEPILPGQTVPIQGTFNGSSRVLLRKPPPYRPVYRPHHEFWLLPQMLLRRKQPCRYLQTWKRSNGFWLIFCFVGSCAILWWSAPFPCFQGLA